MDWKWFLTGMIAGVSCGLFVHILLRASRAEMMERILHSSLSNNPPLELSEANSTTIVFSE